MFSTRIILIFLFLIVVSNAELSNNLRFAQKIYDRCFYAKEPTKCFKIQALKLVYRAADKPILKLTDGISLISSNARTFHPQLNESKLENLDTETIDGLLFDGTQNFLDQHKLEISVPKVLEEARRKKNKMGNAPLLWALAIKGSFLAMAYQGIAVMSGMALIVGKMALILTAILGLKKLVSNGHEKTTFEIVKHPKYTDTHTHSSSYEDEGYYHHRSFDATKF